MTPALRLQDTLQVCPLPALHLSPPEFLQRYRLLDLQVVLLVVLPLFHLVVRLLRPVRFHQENQVQFRRLNQLASLVGSRVCIRRLFHRQVLLVSPLVAHPVLSPLECRVRYRLIILQESRQASPVQVQLAVQLRIPQVAPAGSLVGCPPEFPLLNHLENRAVSPRGCLVVLLPVNLLVFLLFNRPLYLHQHRVRSPQWRLQVNRLESRPASLQFNPL